MTYTYIPRGVCSRQMKIDMENGIIKNVEILGGCSGNLKGISRLVAGMEIDDVIARLDGTLCGIKPTSCPDQLAQALKAYKAENNL